MFLCFSLFLFFLFQPTFRPSFNQIITRLDHILSSAHGTHRGARPLPFSLSFSSSYTFSSFYLSPNPTTPPPDYNQKSEKSEKREREREKKRGAKEYVGALQMTIQVPAIEGFACVAFEGKRVWAGTSAGSFHVWNAEVFFLSFSLIVSLFLCFFLSLFLVFLLSGERLLIMRAFLFLLSSFLFIFFLLFVFDYYYY